MNDWITDRPPTVEEVADDERCVVHLINNHGMSIVGGKFARSEWKYFDGWLKLPEAPKCEMPDEIYAIPDEGGADTGEYETATMPQRFIPHGSVLYVRKDLVAYLKSDIVPGSVVRIEQ
jgi:hypothetical protein